MTNGQEDTEQCSSTSSQKQEYFLQTVAPKSNLTKRIFLAVILIVGFSYVLLSGPIVILLVTTIFQTKCFDEIINIAYDHKKVPKGSIVRTINWCFVIVANYFFYGETFAVHLEDVVNSYRILKVLLTYHRFVSFCLYLTVNLFFVLNLVVKRKEVRKQFSLFFWTHFLLIIIVLQSYMLVNIVFEGVIWCIVTIFFIQINDIFAFIFGRLLGKTPLIKLSPKKTKEGFIYGALSTIVIGLTISQQLCQFNYFICPIKYVNYPSGLHMVTDCEPNYAFQPIEIASVKTFPFVLHCIPLSIFASLIAPFGGFCASGFKRGLRIKDFGDCFPGHGGAMDRIDCVYLMATFVNVYITTFIRTVNVDKIFQKVLALNHENQIKFYFLLERHLNDSILL